MSEQKVSPGRIHLSNVRFSYFYGFEPFKAKPTPQNPKPKDVFTAHGLMAPNHPDLVPLANLIEHIGSTHNWKGGLTWAQVKEQLKAQDKICLHRGDVTKAGAPEYAGLFFISANNARRFTIIGPDRSPLTAADNKPYSGSIGNMIVDVWAQDNTWGRRINATLLGVQHVRDADAFGGGAAPAGAEEFGLVAGSADQAEPDASVDALAGLV